MSSDLPVMNGMPLPRLAPCSGGGILIVAPSGEEVRAETLKASCVTEGTARSVGFSRPLYVVQLSVGVAASGPIPSKGLPFSDVELGAAALLSQLPCVAVRNPWKGQLERSARMPDASASKS